jgi:hypothetical protein
MMCDRYSFWLAGIEAVTPVARRSIFLFLNTVAAAVASGESGNCWPGFVQAPQFAEQVREIRFASEARAIIVAPDSDHFRNDRPTQLVIYATPNGNTIEQTLGCRAAAGLDWHFDIQHVAAQVRQWRAVHTSENVALACVQANVRSWPAWRQTYAEGDQLIRRIVSAIAGQIPGTELHIVLTGHSGGGSFITGYVNSADKIPSAITRIAYLDANYSYSTEQQHGRKFLEWLKTSPQNHLLALAYDDREIELNGKKVVGPTGGTFRASHRFLDYLRERVSLEEKILDEFVSYQTKDGRLRVVIHPNPENKILHTRLVGEMNGLLYALAMGAEETKTGGQLGTPRASSKWVQAAPFQPRDWWPSVPAIPRRRASAPAGSEFVARWSDASAVDRECAIVTELLSGNVPEFLRRFAEIHIDAASGEGAKHEIAVYVMRDYLSIGTDEDFLRIPMTPAIAQCVADAYGCLLPTRKLVDDVHNQADLRLLPRPLTENRQSLSTFMGHQQLIEAQLKMSGVSHECLIAGTKKDVVISNETLSHPNRVAIYGWHYPDGKPIQPLTTVHVAEYVDYSHGVRLVDEHVRIDGRSARASDVLGDEQLHILLSDEGPLATAFYKPAVNP